MTSFRAIAAPLRVLALSFPLLSLLACASSSMVPVGGSGGAAGTGSATGGTTGSGGNSSSGGQAGSRTPEPPTGTGGTSGADAGGDAIPSGPIDYSIWSLQLPIGSGTSPTTISSKDLLAGFTNDYFYKAEDGGQIFMSPASGITTPGSTHCRTEMREMNRTGGGAAWDSTGTNSMTVTGKVLLAGAGSGSSTAVGQLFIGTDSIPLCELVWSSGKGGFQVFYEEAKGAGQTISIDAPAPLNSQYTFVLALTKGVLTISVNDKVVYTRTPTAPTLAKKFYFKVGNYDQKTTAGTPTTTPFTTVEVYKVDVVHE